jgi:biofilm PGA synthesis N-glycosyltransferase PgaC
MSETTGITVLIPFRNEADHLPVIIAALENQVSVGENTEVIWIDDESDDDGLAIVMRAASRNNLWKCLTRQGPPGKKSALQTGVSAAQYNHILTTDADCTMDVEWLYQARAAIQEFPKSDILILPVVVCPENNGFSRLQYTESLQLLVLIAVTSAFGRPVLCSGANLIFRKSFYERSLRCRDDFHIASGDDMFLLQQAENAQFVAAPEILVTTQPTKDWSSFIHQRVRWFGKVRHLKRPRFFLVGILVGIWQFALFSLPLITWFFEWPWMPYALFAITKVLIDISSQWWMSKRLNQPFYPLSSWLYSLLYPMVQILILFMGIFIQPVWKGRAIGR